MVVFYGHWSNNIWVKGQHLICQQQHIQYILCLRNVLHIYVAVHFLALSVPDLKSQPLLRPSMFIPPFTPPSGLLSLLQASMCPYDIDVCITRLCESASTPALWREWWFIARSVIDWLGLTEP